MDSNFKFVNKSIDSEDNPFVLRNLDKIDEQGEFQVNTNKKRRPKAVAAPGLILKEGEEQDPESD